MMTSYRSAGIRDASLADADAILEIYRPIVAETAISFEEEPPSAQEIVSRIKASHVWLVAADANRVVGYAYAGPFHPRAAYRWSAEVSVYVAEQARGRGVARRLISTLLSQLKSRGYVNAFAVVALPSPGSVRLFESLGFEKIAQQKNAGFKLGAWHDVGWWQLELQPPSIPPPQLT
jgi:L-amino acid N-acyltransferase YncA